MSKSSISSGKNNKVSVEKNNPSNEEMAKALKKDTERSVSPAQKEDVEKVTRSPEAKEEPINPEAVDTTDSKPETEGSPPSPSPPKTEAATQLRLVELKGIYDPCILFECSCCNLRTHCLVIAFLEILILSPFAIGQMVTGFEYGYAVVASTTIKYVVILIFYAITILSALAGLLFIIGICTRKKAICFIHCFLCGLLVLLCLINFATTCYLVNDAPRSNQGRVILTAFGWFAAVAFYIIAIMCSYGLYTQIRAGIDLLFPMTREQRAQFSSPMGTVRSSMRGGPITVIRNGGPTVVPMPYHYAPAYSYGYNPMYGYGGPYGYGYGYAPYDGLYTGLLVGSMLGGGWGHHHHYYNDFGGYGGDPVIIDGGIGGGMADVGGAAAPASDSFGF